MKTTVSKQYFNTNKRHVLYCLSPCVPWTVISCFYAAWLKKVWQEEFNFLFSVLIWNMCHVIIVMSLYYKCVSFCKYPRIEWGEKQCGLTSCSFLLQQMSSNNPFWGKQYNSVPVRYPSLLWTPVQHHLPSSASQCPCFPPCAKHPQRGQ